MVKQDLRKLSRDEKFFLRKQVVRASGQGLRVKAIVELVGLTAVQVRVILREFKVCGKVEMPKKPGRKSESKMLLTPEQELEIKRTIIDKTPEQLKFAFALWTREAVCQLVESKYGIRFSVRCATNYLKRWGMTCQRPVKRAYYFSN